jgi:CheY-like chemotaxis protein
LSPLLGEDIEQPAELAVLDAFSGRAKNVLSPSTRLDQIVEYGDHFIVVHVDPPSLNKRAIAIPLGMSCVTTVLSWASVAVAPRIAAAAGTNTPNSLQRPEDNLHINYEYKGKSVDKRIVLVVEDSPTDEALLLRALEKSGITNPIVVVKDGLEAIQYLFGTGRYEFRNTEEFPAIVLIDLNLPKLDGLEVLRRMRSDYRTKLVPVAIFTSSIEEQDLINGYSLGANSYVRKPIEFSKFAKVVAQLVNYWIQLNEPPPPGEKIWAHHFDRSA